MTKTSKITLAVLGVLIVALVGGYLGAGLRGGSSASAADSGAPGNAAFLQKIKDRGELRVGVWLANGAAGEQSGAKAAVKLPRANAAAGWGGDRLVSLNGPDGQWAIVWQTKWDSEKDVDQFVGAADAVIAGLSGVGLVAPVDISSGVSNPALVLIASSDETLVSVADALGVAVAEPA